MSELIQRLPVAVVITDLAGAPVEWNERAATLLNWPAGPAEGQASFLKGEPRWFQRVRKEALTGESPAAALLLRHCVGGDRSIRLQATVLRDAAGRPDRFLFTLRDVTTRLGLERRLRNSERRFQRLIDQSLESIAIYQDQQITYANAAAGRMLHAVRPEDLVGRHIMDFVHPDSREAVANRLRLAHARPTDIVEQRLVTVDGVAIEAEVTSVPIVWGRGPAVLMIARDMTARRQVEASLRASKQRFRLLAEGVRDYAIVMLDAEGGVLSWNAGAERVTGYPAHEAVRRHVSEVLPAVEGEGSADTALLLRRAAEQGRVEEEGPRVRRDGARFWASMTLTALQGRDRGIVGFAAIVRDLTERRAAEDALRRSEENLRQAQKMDAVGRLAGGIAHDFNNLLTAIQGHAQFLIEDLQDSETSYGDAVEIKRAADRASALTRQLLIFSRRQVLEPQILDLNLVTRDIHSLLRRVIREDIRLEMHLADDIWPVRADASQMEQVLMNLAVNARDAMPGGGVLTIRTRNRVVDGQPDIAGGAVPAGEYVQVVVSDTGIGMDRETQARIFEPFFTTKAEGEGTGLGLATVYGIVRQSNGTITVYSEPGQGSTFRILLPAANEAEAARLQPAPGELARGWESVLVVEDDPGIRALTSRALQGRGYSVLEAASGPEALRLAEEYDGPIDLVISDIIMPEMSGRRLAETMHNLHPSARLLFMSGFTPEEVVRQGLVDPDAKFLEKPFSADALARTVRSILDEPRS